MKRPDQVALFAPARGEPAEVARAFLDLGEREFWARLTRSSYETLKLDPDSGKYHAEGGADLSGREDLVQRIARDGSALWDCEMLWYNELLAEVRAAVLRDPGGKAETTLKLLIDPRLTRLVEDENEARMPYVLFLCRIAEVIGCPWFVSGPRITSWKPLTVDQLPGAGDLGLLYVVGWKRDSPVSEAILRYYRWEPEGLGTTLLGYDFWAMFSLVN